MSRTLCKRFTNFNDLVDLSCEVNKETNKEPNVVVLNSDLESLSYLVPTTSVDSVNSNHITFEICNNCPFVQGKVSNKPTYLFYVTMGRLSPRLVRLYLTKSQITRK